MSFVSRPGYGARVPRAHGEGLGWWDSLVTICTSLGDVGDPAPRGDVEILQRQLNRYTMDGGAPVQLRIGTAPLPITGAIDPETATRAVWIMQMRAGLANIAWNDGATKKLLDEAMKAWSSPAPFVAKNLSRITQVVKLFADKHGIPAAKGLAVGMTPTIVVGAITVGALALIFRGGKRKR